jgi:hypothetical protein
MSGSEIAVNPFWLDKLESSFAAFEMDFESFVEFLAEDSHLSKDEILSRLGEILPNVKEFSQRSNAKRGLGIDLADGGLLPLYGMPTRARTLYTGFDYKSESGWREIDRDLETAIYEFAPGASLIKDKLKHTAVGFTGRLMKPMGRRDQPIAPISEPFTRQMWISECGVCRSWQMLDSDPDGNQECSRCGSLLPEEMWFLGREPSAFRTDFWAKDDEQQGVSRGYRNSIPVTVDDQFVHLEGTNSSIVSSRGHVLALNRGSYLADQIRLCAKKDKRILYVIYSGKIASAKSLMQNVIKTSLLISAAKAAIAAQFLKLLLVNILHAFFPASYSKSNFYYESYLVCGLSSFVWCDN